MLDIFLIRHAESQGNVNRHLIGGRSDHFLLTDQGEIQAKKLGERLVEENLQFDEVFSSIAVRAHETARIVCKELSIPQQDIQLDERLVELSQGNWEGQVRSEILTPDMRATIAQNPWKFQPPGGESVKDVEERMYAWLWENLQKMPASGTRIAVFSHGMAIKSLFRKLTDATYDLPRNTVIHNTAITRLMFNDPYWLIDRLNDHAHLIGMNFVPHYG